jgi:dTDP-3-amino-3,4,6-trideoxy-alpha-D-glucose transaminase|tara:strand:- start:5553 stop:6692 length:1140 start_codon:yes stop_codon:yes gene_type:complete
MIKRLETMKVLPNTFDRLWTDCSSDILAAVERVGASGWYILGKEVVAFEAALAVWAKTPYVVGVANGMDALEIAFRIRGIGPGDKVLTTPLSAFPTALSILRAGATPVYCDTDKHGLLDVAAAEAAFASHPDIKAIAPVHLYGHLADMNALQTLADKYGAIVFEDAAQAIGATRHGIQVGDNGRMASLSFYPTKNLGVLGDGGALLVHTEADNTVAQAMRNYGQTAKYVHDIPGLNSRLDEVHAATLTDAFLPRLSDWLKTRKRIAKTYLENITHPAVTLMPGPDTEGAGWHLFPVLVDIEKRDAFVAYLQNAGIGAALHYPILMPEQRAITDYSTPVICGNLDTARRIANSEVSLPIHPYLSEEEQAYVIATINAWSE